MVNMELPGKRKVKEKVGGWDKVMMAISWNEKIALNRAVWKFHYGNPLNRKKKKKVLLCVFYCESHVIHIENDSRQCPE